VIAAPTPGPEVLQLTFRLMEPVELLPGQTATLEGTGIEVVLIEAHGPKPGCYDCPASARLMVRSTDETVELGWSFSGNMPSEALKTARRKTALGFVFIAERIAEGSLTIQVEPIEP